LFKKAVAKTRITDCADTEKKSADADEKNKKVKVNAENGFFSKKITETD
jgi:hypothetical protein